MEGRQMADGRLLRGLEDLASKVRLLERENMEYIAKIQALERENSEMAALIALATAKVDQMLKDGATADMSQPQAVHRLPKYAAHERLGESPADRKKQPKRLFPNAFIPD